MTNLFIDLKTKAAAAGTNLTAVCARAGVHRSVPERWKTAVPRSMRTALKLYRELEILSGAPEGSFTPPVETETAAAV